MMQFQELNFFLLTDKVAEVELGLTEHFEAYEGVHNGSIGDLALKLDKDVKVIGHTTILTKERCQNSGGVTVDATKLQRKLCLLEVQFCNFGICVDAFKKRHAKSLFLLKQHLIKVVSLTIERDTLTAKGEQLALEVQCVRSSVEVARYYVCVVLKSVVQCDTDLTTTCELIIFW